MAATSPSTNGHHANGHAGTNGVHHPVNRIRGSNGAATAAPPSATGSNGAATALRVAPPVAPAAVSPPAPPTNSGRDASTGRFVKGNKLAKGNPHARRQAALRSVLLDAVDESRLRRIVQRLADQAEAGDVAATKLLLAYLLGRPTSAPDPDRLDLDEYELLASAPTVEAFLVAMNNRMPHNLAAELAIRGRPATDASEQERLASAFQRIARFYASYGGPNPFTAPTQADPALMDEEG
jgi:hypothetical protein